METETRPLTAIARVLVPPTWKCFRSWVAIAFAVYWNAAGGLLLLLLAIDSTPSLSIWVPSIFLSTGLSLFAVVLSRRVRDFVFHPERAHYYRPRDLIVVAAYITVLSLIGLVSALS